MTDKEMYEQTLKAWGFEAQLDMVIEECAELIKEINKWRRGKSQGVEVIKEMADVSLMIEQMRRYSQQPNNRFGVLATSFDFWRREKINRVKKMLREGR